MWPTMRQAAEGLTHCGTAFGRVSPAPLQVEKGHAVRKDTLHGGFLRCTSSSCGASPATSGLETMAASTVTDGRGYLRLGSCKKRQPTQPASATC